MRLKSPYSGAHITLKRLWDERIAPTGISQEEFGEKYGIGTQGMVSQYLLGTRPLNYDAAAKFAWGFNCTIEEICPEMARTIVKDILPVLRGSLRRRRAAACVALMSFFSAASFTPHDAQAFDISQIGPAIHRNTHWMRLLLTLDFLWRSVNQLRALFRVEFCRT